MNLEFTGIVQSSGLTPAEANPPVTELVSKKNTKAFIWKCFGSYLTKMANQLAISSVAFANYKC